MLFGAVVFVGLLLPCLPPPAAGDDLPEPSCRRANFEVGCGEDGCDFSVSWRRGHGRQVTLEVATLVPHLGEDRWTTVLLLGTSEITGAFLCQWSHQKWSHNCSLTGKEGALESVGCLTANTTYHSPILTCSFTLPVTESWTRLVAHPLTLHITTTTSGSGSERSVYQASSKCPCNVTDCHDSCGGCAPVTSSKCHSAFSLLLIRSHAILMVVTFLLLLPTGITIARYGRPVFPHTWFRAHAITNLSGLTLMVLALAAVLGHAGGSFSVGLHQVLGVICISLVLFQALCGFLRPAVGVSLQRRVFSFGHRTLGAVILALGTLTMLLGAILYKNSVYIVVVVVLAAAILVEAGLLIAMEALLRMRHTATAPVGYQRVQGTGDGDFHDSGSDGELYVKEGGGGGGDKQMKDGSDESPLRPLEMHTNTKRVMAVFTAQGFLFCAVIGVLILYGQH